MEKHSQVIIEPNRMDTTYLYDLYRYRELFFFFIIRDLRVRYKQAVLGISWAIIRPMLTMFLFAYLFGHVARFSSEGVSYSAFVLAGMLPWQLCANAINDSGHSFLNSVNLISKAYFPRMLIPISQVVVHLPDFLINILVLFALAYGTDSLYIPTLFAIPIFLFISLLFCFGTGLWLSSLTVKYRDFRFLIALALQFGIFLSPVGYGTFMIDAKWIWFYSLNPMVGIIDGFRWAFFGITHPHIILTVGVSTSISLLLVLSGFHYFRKTERTFVDTI